MFVFSFLYQDKRHSRTFSPSGGDFQTLIHPPLLGEVEEKQDRALMKYQRGEGCEQEIGRGEEKERRDGRMRVGVKTAQENKEETREKKEERQTGGGGRGA